jgi:hypothetical protein
VKTKVFELKEDSYVLLQQMLLVFFRRLVRLCLVACPPSQVTKPCSEQILRHLGWPKKYVNEAIRVMDRDKRSDLNYRLIESYYENNGWTDIFSKESLISLFYYIFSICISDGLNDVNLGRKKTLNASDLIEAWRGLQSSAKVVINDILV